MRIEKKLKAYFIVASMLFCFGAASLANGAGSQAQTYEIIAGMTVPAGTFQAMFWEDLKKYVEDKSEGRLKLTLHYSASLGNDTEMLQKVMINTIQAVNGSSANFSVTFKELKTLDMPYLVEQPQDYQIFYDENWNIGGPLGDYIQEILGKKGMRAMFFNPFQFRELNTKGKLVKTPEDLKGMKIRTSASAVEIAILESLGGSAVPAGISEVYGMLQQGVVDGLTLGPVLSWTFKFPEIAKNFSKVNFQALTVLGMMNKKFYDDLPDDLKKILDDGLALVSKNGMKYLELSEKDTMDTLAKMNIQYFDPTPQELKSFKDKAMPIYDKFKADLDPKMVELVNQAKAGLK